MQNHRPCLFPPEARSLRVLFKRFSVDEAGVPTLSPMPPLPSPPAAQSTTAYMAHAVPRPCLAELQPGTAGWGARGITYTPRWCQSGIHTAKKMKQVGMDGAEGQVK